MGRKKLLAMLLGMTLAAGSLAGCGGGGAKDTPAPAQETKEDEAAVQTKEDEPEQKAAAEKEEITLWHYYTTVNGENFEKMVEAYNNLPEGRVHVTVELIPRAELLKKYTLGIATGDLPEIAIVDNPDAASLTAAGMFEEVTEMLNGWEGNSFVSGPLESGQYEGKQYTLPFRSNCLGLFVNEEHLEAAGVEKVPETWDELLSACEKLKGMGTPSYPFAMSAVKSEEGVFHFMPFFQSTGATVNEADSEGGIKAFEMIAQLASEGYMSNECINWTQNDVEKQFAAGNASMMINGSWQISNILADAPELEYSIAYIPKDKESVSSLGGENIGITKSAENVEACWDFVSWMLSRENNVPFNVAGAAISPRADVTPEEQYPEDEKMRVFVELFEMAKPRGPHPKWTEISGAYQEGIQAVLVGSKTPEEAAAAVAGKIAEINASVE